jgi:hypothetical protein
MTEVMRVMSSLGVLNELQRAELTRHRTCSAVPQQVA